MFDNPEKLLIECLRERRAIETKNELIYTAGFTGFDFFDLTKLTLSPETLEKVVFMYLDLLEKVKEAGIKYNKLAFLQKTIGPIVLASNLAQKTGKELLVVKETVPTTKKLTYELAVKGSVEPPVLEGDKIILVSDVISSGGTVLKGVNILEEAGGEVVAVVAIVDRQITIDEKNAKEVFEERNIPLFTLITRERLLSLGFIEPSKEDLENEDYFDLLKKIICIKIGEGNVAQNLEEIIEKNKNFLDLKVEKLLKDKGIATTEENKRLVRNMFLATTMIARTDALISE
ncbi:MAG: hypothetical protein GF308_18160 [Candidatus Heimdallarchaeota archaeon]|nr:hypothetical protein [Candidatus Heimdallarchaeota archaeon]